MKTINFTAKEVLNSLLNKTKVQTIRIVKEGKPAKFKVGDKVHLIWDERSKRQLFCADCGKPMLIKEVKCTCGCNIQFFKLLGLAEITEVFKIKMSIYDVKRIDKPLYSVDELAKLDGFEDYFEMIKWFDTKYDLSLPQKFFVYRWIWLKQEPKLKLSVNRIHYVELKH